MRHYPSSHTSQCFVSEPLADLDLHCSLDRDESPCSSADLVCHSYPDPQLYGRDPAYWGPTSGTNGPLDRRLLSCLHISTGSCLEVSWIGYPIY
jgi:hypothetical protein